MLALLTATLATVSGIVARPVMPGPKQPDRGEVVPQSR